MDNENLKQLLEYLQEKNLNVTININISENRGLTWDEYQEARKQGKGISGKETQF